MCCKKSNNMLNIPISSCGTQSFGKIDLDSIKLPWSVKIEDNGTEICFGSIINPRVIVTLAQCVDGRDTKKLIVSLGSWSHEHFEYDEEREVDRIIFHPKFVENEMTDDIALVILKTASSNNVFVNPICLPHNETTFDTKSCFLLGNDDDTTKTMNVQNLTVMSCENDQKLSAIIPKNSICIEKSSYIMSNSLGAGLVCKIDDGDAFELAGIFQQGNDFTTSSFVNIADYRTWIDEIMTQLELKPESYIYDPTASRCDYEYMVVVTYYYRVKRIRVRKCPPRTSRRFYKPKFSHCWYH